MAGQGTDLGTGKPVEGKAEKRKPETSTDDTGGLCGSFTFRWYNMMDRGRSGLYEEADSK